MTAPEPAGLDARNRADRIRAGLASIATTYQDIGEAVAIAYHQRDWGTLGYESWDAYVEGEFAGHLPKLNRDERRQFVGELRESGLSVRAIGSVAGVSHQTVANDLGAGVNNLTPADGDDASHSVTGTDEPSSPPVPTPPSAPRPSPTIRGADGRQYPSSRPAPPRPQSEPPAPPPVRNGQRGQAILTGVVVDPGDAQRDAELEAEMEATAARFRRNFSAALARADDVWQFDVDRIAELYAANFETDLDPWLREMARWCQRVTDTVRRSRTGLRVMQGGRR